MAASQLNGVCEHWQRALKPTCFPAHDAAGQRRLRQNCAEGKTWQNLQRLSQFRSKASVFLEPNPIRFKSRKAGSCHVLAFSRSCVRFTALRNVNIYAHLPLSHFSVFSERNKSFSQRFLSSWHRCVCETSQDVLETFGLARLNRLLFRGNTRILYTTGSGRNENK